MAEPKQTFSNQVEVRIDGVELGRELASRLGACWVESSVNLPTAFHLTLRDANQKLLEDYGMVLKLGAAVEVYAIADQQGRDTPLVTGAITGIETEFDGRTTATVIRGLDHAFKMMRRRRTAGYPEMTADEIIRDLAVQDGARLGPEIEPCLERYRLITQPNISDWQFAGELARRNGMFVDFDNRGRLRLRRLPRADEDLDIDDALPTILRVGTNVRRCRTGLTAMEQVGTVTVRGWDVEANEPLESTKPALSYRGRVIEAGAADALARGGGAPTFVETRTPYGTVGQVADAAVALAEDLSSVFAELEVLVDGNPELAPGKTVTLQDAGASFDGRYTVTSARHEFGADNSYLTWVAVTGRQVRSVYGLASGASESANRIPGVVNAIVDDINDPKQQGRVKVRFPWFDDEYKTQWARTLQFGGKGGGVLSPAVGDEVLVAFDRGEMDYPYVLGGLYGHRTNVPSAHDVDLVTEGHLNRQSLVSRAGHRLELLDAEDGAKHGVRLQSGDRQLTVFVDQFESEIKITAGTERAATISLSSDGRISIRGGSDVSVSSDASVSVQAPTVSVKGDVTIDGSLNVVGKLNQVFGAASFAGASFNVLADAGVRIVGTSMLILPPPV